MGPKRVGSTSQAKNWFVQIKIGSVYVTANEAREFREHWWVFVLFWMSDSEMFLYNYINFQGIEIQSNII